MSDIEPGLIEGVVTAREDGDVIEGATIKAVRQSDGSVETTTSGEDGSFSMSVSGGVYHVTVRYRDPQSNIYRDFSYPFVNVESAIPDSVVFQPDTGDLEEFTIEEGGFDIVQTPNFGDGDNTIYGFRDNDDNPIAISTSGLDAYPSVNQRLSCKIQASSDSIIKTSFAAQDSSNYYQLDIREASDEIRILKDGDVEVAETVDSGISSGTPYLQHWYWRDTTPNIEYELFNIDDDPLEDDPLGSVTYNDTEYTNGGIKLSSSRSETVDVDVYWADYYIMQQL